MSEAQAQPLTYPKISNSMPPIISFITPALNEEKQIATTLEPLKSLNLDHNEIIVADGGSTDRTLELARIIADKVYDRNGGRNKSIAENRNKGATLAVGKYLFFIDCGVRIERLSEFIEECLKLFEAKPELVGITLKIRFFPAEENLLDKIILGIINTVVRLFNRMRIGVAMGWVQVVRAEAFRQIGGFNENLVTAEDSDLFCRLNKIGRTVCLKSFIVYGSAKRYHQDGWTKAIWRWLINLIWYIWKKESYTKKWEEV